MSPRRHDTTTRAATNDEPQPAAAAAAVVATMVPGVIVRSSFQDDGEDDDDDSSGPQSQLLRKRNKKAASSDEPTPTIHEGGGTCPNSHDVAGPSKEQRTGISYKLASINQAIKEKEEEITTQGEEIRKQTKAIQDKKVEIRETRVTPEYSSMDPLVLSRDQLSALYHQLSALMDEVLALQDELLALQDELFALQDELNALMDERNALLREFHRGEYYAPTADYLQVKDLIPNDSSKWKSFVRDAPRKDVVSKYHCRRTTATSTTIQVFDPYQFTSDGVKDDGHFIPRSQTTESEHGTTMKNVLWPSDVFGNKPTVDQEIAHLLPAGREKSPHKQWLNVAAAVLGFGPESTLAEKKKAARGYKNKENGKRTSKSGVVHFISNKIRLDNPATKLDGTAPKLLILPVMSLEEAKEWRGQGYKAICFGGYPRGSVLSGSIGGESVYKAISLNDDDLFEVDYTCDANQAEIEKAIVFLKQAVLALRDMIANLTEEEITYADGTTVDKQGAALREAHQEAQDALLCKVPSLVASSSRDRKPACLVSFGDVRDSDRHPAPDPLLLVVKAANSFGIMAGMKMLANGSQEDGDDDISERDIMAEEAFLEARERSLRPKTSSDLAIGLGQPNGFLATL